MGSVLLGPGDLQTDELDVVAAQKAQNPGHGRTVVIAQIQIHFQRASQDQPLQLGKEQLRNHDQGGESQTALDEAGTQGQPRDGGGPESGGCGQPLHPLVPGDNDGASADEADAGHHLGADPGHIRVIVQIQGQKLAGHDGDGGTQTNENMGAQSGGTAAIGALQTDDAAAQHRKAHPDGGGEHGQLPQGGENR